MATEHKERTLTRRGFLRLGIGLAGALLVGTVSKDSLPLRSQEGASVTQVEPSTVVAREKALVTTPVTLERRGVEINPALAAYIENADRAVKRFGHADFNPSKGLY